MPELQLRMSDYRVGVENFEDILHLVAHRSVIVHLNDYGGVGLFAAELHKNAAAHTDALLHLLRHTIGE